MKKLSLILIAILLSSIAPLLSVHSQPNGCININGIKTPELIAQFEIWLNEPDGLNSRFLDSTESSQERGERLFYDLVLNNSQICLSDLTQEIIDSITEVIRSYDNSPNHTYQVGAFTITRSQINLGFKAIHNPIILGYRSIFAEAIQQAVPIDDRTDLNSDQWLMFDGLATNLICNDPISNCYTGLDEGFPFIDTAASERIHNNDADSNELYVANLTALNDPMINDGFFFNYTIRKTTSAGKQYDTNSSLVQGDSIIIQSEIIIDFTSITAQIRNVTITESNASLITDFSNLFMQFNANGVGGGAIRTIIEANFQLSVPDLENFQPIITNPTLWGLFNTSDTLYSILSFDGRDKVFQDQQIRLNLTVTDLNGRDNITEVHAAFNGTIIVLSFDEDSMSFSTSTPSIIENLAGIATEIVDGYNVTFIFSLSSDLTSGYYWLTNANVTDDNTNSTLVRERWFSFIQQAGAGGGGLTQLSLSPIGPQIMLIFIIIGLIALGQSNPWFVLAGWVSMFVAFGLMLTGQYYVGVDSSDNFLSFNQFFPEEFNVWLFRFFIAMQFIYPFRILALMWEKVINVTKSLRDRLS